ncbi:EAL domain-containing protein [Sporomusa sphaeroides DSM 2875]|uniref:EAL domain-containing protein n=1 Tax=Sporomusa sphaeroides TaxID=47679 RepID=UPI00203060CC|nr:EAL domain-containing protein [Sporomusa sphaeroides]MCM0761220.1 EAL domain-containing protein [Sporomusa sphaeroides DSM 2875]
MSSTSLLAFLENLSRQRHLTAIRQGMVASMPLVLLGSLTIMFISLPFAAYQEFLSRHLGTNADLFANRIIEGTYNILSLVFVIAISYFLAKEHPVLCRKQFNPFLISLLSLSCFIVWMQPVMKGAAGSMPTPSYGIISTFPAIVTAVVTTELFAWLACRPALIIKYTPNSVDPILTQITRILPALTLTILIFATAKMASDTVVFTHLSELFYAGLRQLFGTVENQLAQLLLFTLLSHLLWLCGLHGINILHAILDRIDLVDVYTIAHTTLGNVSTAAPALNKTFLETFAYLGGSGSSLCLILAFFLASRRAKTDPLIKFALLPGLFNINEVLIFGLPILFNPVYFLPFLLVPVVSILLAYFAIISGLVPPITQPVGWTTPPILNAYLATGSIAGVILQLLTLTIGTAMYFPFVRLHEKSRQAALWQAFSDFLEEIETRPVHLTKPYLDRQDAVGALARRLHADLKEDLAGDRLCLEYQPQVNAAGRVIGIEALLRWPHQHYGRIAPPITITIAEESGLILDLGRWVLREACRQQKEWENAGNSGQRIAVNVSALQLECETLDRDIADALSAAGLSASQLEIEITETAALKNPAATNAILHNIRQTGVRIAIDDFGAGHTSLLYLKNYPIDILKIDRILSQDVLTDKNSQEIIASITSLCASLHIETITEFVETELQRQKLAQLGCGIYQGYLYSPALPADQAAAYIRQQNQGINNTG